jgi:hypothetical protein
MLSIKKAEGGRNIECVSSWLKDQCTSWQLESFPDDITQWDEAHYFGLNAALFSTLVLQQISRQGLSPAAEDFLRVFYACHTKALLAAPYPTGLLRPATVHSVPKTWS